MRGYSTIRCASRAWRAGFPACRNAAWEAMSRRRTARQALDQPRRFLNTSSATSPVPSETTSGTNTSSEPSTRYETTAPDAPSTPSQPIKKISPKPGEWVSPEDVASLPLPEQLRCVLRYQPHPVVVCTARDVSDDELSSARGMTISSFTSLSLQPTPLITFNIATPSRTLDAIRSHPGGRFNIHFLLGDANGAEVVKSFTRPDTAKRMFERLIKEDRKLRLDGSAPLLGIEELMYCLQCRLAVDEAPQGGIIQVRDHAIVIGEVVGVTIGDGAKKSPSYGLSYLNGEYTAPGTPLQV